MLPARWAALLQPLPQLRAPTLGSQQAPGDPRSTAAPCPAASRISTQPAREARGDSGLEPLTDFTREPNTCGCSPGSPSHPGWAQDTQLHGCVGPRDTRSLLITLLGLPSGTAPPPSLLPAPRNSPWVLVPSHRGCVCPMDVPPAAIPPVSPWGQES